MANRPRPGEVNWMDLTVTDAERVRDFYCGVAGWTAQGCDMGGYEDYVMMAGATPVGGVCHAWGVNLDLPPVWLLYINVADLDEALARVASLGGEVAREPTSMSGHGRFAVVKDPAGAFVGLFQPTGINDPKPAKKQARKTPSPSKKAATKTPSKNAGKNADKKPGKKPGKKPAARRAPKRR